MSRVRTEKELVLGIDGDLQAAHLEDAKRIGVRRVLLLSGSRDSVKGLHQLRVSNDPGEDNVSWVRVSGSKGIEEAITAGDRDQAFVVVECSDWRIIPLENLIAEFRRRGRKLYTFASSKEEIETAFTILESGVDGVVIPPALLGEAAAIFGNKEFRFGIEEAKVTRVEEAGTGDRACIDTTSHLNDGEGVLVGSKASFFFLVHGETLPSEYIPPRPFRVNAGSIHSYILNSSGRTNYLSELEAPVKVTLVDSEGSAREAYIGRVKVERRPMIFIEASAGGVKGSVILQKAETIRLVSPHGNPVSVTDLKPGDSVLVHLEPVVARHFGGEVDEYIEEK